MQEIVNILKLNNKTISTMESCTGGALVNEITNIEGASNVLCFSAVTYSNDFKIKMGVDKEIIDKYTVYSIETAKSMSKAISDFTNSNYGIGITGKLNRIDENNLYGENNQVFISIYDKDNDCFFEQIIKVKSNNRCQCKEEIITLVQEMLFDILKKI